MQRTGADARARRTYAAWVLVAAWAEASMDRADAQNPTPGDGDDGDLLWPSVDDDAAELTKQDTTPTTTAPPSTTVAAPSTTTAPPSTTTTPPPTSSTEPVPTPSTPTPAVVATEASTMQPLPATLAHLRTASPSASPAALRANPSSAHRGVPPWWTPYVFVGCAAVAIALLSYMWTRRRHRRGSRGGSSDDSTRTAMPMATSTAIKSSADGGGRSAGDAAAIKSRVQYSRIEDRSDRAAFDEEAMEYGDVGVDADDRADQWDDWGGDDARDGADEPQEGDAEQDAVALLMPSSAASTSVGIHMPSTFLSTPAAELRTAELKEMLGSERGPTAGSNSSSESFELVRPQADGLATATTTTTATVTTTATTAATTAATTTAVAALEEAEAEGTTEEDLFSQFGMVPTFKKTTPTPTSAASEAMIKAATEAEAEADAVAASALFSAELDELASAATATAGEEWGAEEDEDWVQGL